jgi:hypothetical protein
MHVPAPVVELQNVPAPQVHAVTWPVQVFVTDVLQLLPHDAVFVQHVPVWPDVPTCMPPDEHTRPPVQSQVRPVVSPGKRPNVGVFERLHGAFAPPVAPYVAHVLSGMQTPAPVVELQYAFAPQLHAVTCPVQVFMTLVLHMLPHVMLFTQHVPR